MAIAEPALEPRPGEAGPPPVSARSTVVLSGVSRSFGDNPALRDLDLEVPEARITVLLGPNGAGKTTAIRMITGALDPDAGTVRVFGQDPNVDGEAVRRLALGGVGCARLALFHIGPDIEAGRLVPVLQNYNPGDREDIHAIYVGHAGPLPARVRSFIDFLATHIRMGDFTLRRMAGGKWKLHGGR